MKNSATLSKRRQYHSMSTSYSSKGQTPLVNIHCENDEELEQRDEYLKNLKMYGYMIIFITWLIFIVSIGTIFNLWQWCFSFDPYYIAWFKSIHWISVLIDDVKQQNESAVDNYYILLFFLVFVILWIWAVDSWISMKLFRHSKGGGS